MTTLTEALVEQAYQRGLAEAKDLAEVAGRFGYELGRKEALVEAERAIRAFDYDRLASVGLVADVRTVHTALAKIIRDMASQPSGAASKPLAASTGHSDDLPEGYQGPWAPSQEPCEDPACPIALMHSHPELHP